MLTELSGRIVKIEYAVGDTFNVFLERAQPAIADNVFNQLAIDAAFERRAEVVLELEGDRIRRVQSDVPPANPGPAHPRPGDVRITRISTQLKADTGQMIAEIFYEPNPGQVSEKQVRTSDPIAHLLCHGAYIAAHPLALVLDGDDIIGIKKSAPPAGN